MCIFVGNIAYKKRATHKALRPGSHAPHNAVDGIIVGMNGAVCPFTHTSWGDGYPAWWQVDLGRLHIIYNITVISRLNQHCKNTHIHIYTLYTVKQHTSNFAKIKFFECFIFAFFRGFYFLCVCQTLYVNDRQI